MRDTTGPDSMISRVQVQQQGNAHVTSCATATLRCLRCSIITVVPDSGRAVWCRRRLVVCSHGTVCHGHRVAAHRDIARAYGRLRRPSRYGFPAPCNLDTTTLPRGPRHRPAPDRSPRLGSRPADPVPQAENRFGMSWELTQPAAMDTDTYSRFCHHRATAGPLRAAIDAVAVRHRDPP